MEQKLIGSPVVLLVEDEPLVRMTTAEMLEDAGYEVIQAANADEALAVMKTRTDVSVLFTDIRMPGRLDGLQLARKVHEQWQDVVLLLTSANVMLERADIPDDGKFIAKPYHGSQMVREIDRMVGRAR